MILARISPVFYISLSITLNLIGQLGKTNIDQDSFTSYFPLIGYMQVLRNILSMKYHIGNLQIIIHHNSNLCSIRYLEIELLSNQESNNAMYGLMTLVFIRVKI